MQCYICVNLLLEKIKNKEIFFMYVMSKPKKNILSKTKRFKKGYINKKEKICPCPKKITFI